MTAAPLKHVWDPSIGNEGNVNHFTPEENKDLANEKIVNAGGSGGSTGSSKDSGAEAKVVHVPPSAEEKSNVDGLTAGELPTHA